MDQITVWVNILKCADGSYYFGKYQGEHNTRSYPDSYTSKRVPVELVWSEWFSRYDAAVAFERQVKGWSRAKKEALIRGDWDRVQELSGRGVRPSLILRDGSKEPPQDEDGASGKKKYQSAKKFPSS